MSAGVIQAAGVNTVEVELKVDEVNKSGMVCNLSIYLFLFTSSKNFSFLLILMFLVML